MFLSMSNWGFPYKSRTIIESYKKGVLTLAEALNKLGEIYPSVVKKYYTYNNDGRKIPHTCIEFGCPTAIMYTF